MITEPPPPPPPVVTSRTIAKGVFFGMWMFALSAAAVSLVLSMLFFAVAMYGGSSPPSIRSPEENSPGGYSNREDCMDDPATTYDQCDVLFPEE